MGFPRILTTLALGVTLAVATIGCGQQSTPPPSPSTAPSKSAAPSTAASGVPSPAAQQSPAASSPSTNASASAKPAGSPSGASVAASDLVAKAKGTAEYSFTYKVSGAGEGMSGKTYIKGTKVRQEASVSGLQTVLLIDTSSKIAYTLMPNEKVSMKMDFSQASAQVERPADRTGALSGDVKPSGTETIDGKAAAVFDLTDGQDKGKYWLWIERGLPLKMETTGPSGKMTIEYTDYQFVPQPDSLFEVPSGYQTIEMPTGLPGLPSGVPGLPGSIPQTGR